MENIHYSDQVNNKAQSTVGITALQQSNFLVFLFLNIVLFVLYKIDFSIAYNCVVTCMACLIGFRSSYIWYNNIIRQMSVKNILNAKLLFLVFNIYKFIMVFSI